MRRPLQITTSPGLLLPAVSTRVLEVPMCSGGPGSCAREPASGVSIRPAHLWLLEAPSPCVRERDRWVLALSALSAMSVPEAVCARQGGAGSGGHHFLLPESSARLCGLSALAHSAFL